MTLRHTACIGLVLLGLQSMVAPGIAQEQQTENQSYQPMTGGDSAIPVDHLKVMLRPLMKKELEAEEQLWLDLLRSTISEVGNIELKLKSLSETESGEALTAQLVELRKEETALAVPLHGRRAPADLACIGTANSAHRGEPVAPM